MLLSRSIHAEMLAVSHFSFLSPSSLCLYSKWELLLWESLHHPCVALHSFSPWMVSTFGWCHTGPTGALVGTERRHGPTTHYDHDRQREQCTYFTADWQQVNWLNPPQHCSLESIHLHGHLNSPSKIKPFTIICSKQMLVKMHWDWWHSSSSTVACKKWVCATINYRELVLYLNNIFTCYLNEKHMQCIITTIDLYFTFQ